MCASQPGLQLSLTSTTPPWSVKMSLACSDPMPLVVPVMSQRQIWASSEPDSRWPSRKGLQARPYLEGTHLFMVVST